MTKAHTKNGTFSFVPGVHTAGCSTPKGGLHNIRPIENIIDNKNKEAFEGSDTLKAMGVIKKALARDIYVCLGDPKTRDACRFRYKDTDSGFFCCSGTERGKC
jgi:hypothetical protein